MKNLLKYAYILVAAATITSGSVSAEPEDVIAIRTQLTQVQTELNRAPELRQPELHLSLQQLKDHIRDRFDLAVVITCLERALELYGHCSAEEQRELGTRSRLVRNVLANVSILADTLLGEDVTPHTQTVFEYFSNEFSWGWGAVDLN